LYEKYKEAIEAKNPTFETALKNAGTIDFSLDLGAQKISESISQKLFNGNLGINNYPQLKREVEKKVKAATDAFVKDDHPNGAHLVVDTEGKIVVKSKSEYYETQQQNSAHKAILDFVKKLTASPSTAITGNDIVTLHQNPQNRLVGDYMIKDGHIILLEEKDNVDASSDTFLQEYQRLFAGAGVESTVFNNHKVKITDVLVAPSNNGKYLDAQANMYDEYEEAEAANELYQRADESERNQLNLDEEIDKVMSGNGVFALLFKLLRSFGIPVKTWLKSGGMMGNMVRGLVGVEAPQGVYNPLSEKVQRYLLDVKAIQEKNPKLVTDTSFKSEFVASEIHASFPSTGDFEKMPHVKSLVENVSRFDGAQISEFNVKEQYMIVDPNAAKNTAGMFHFFPTYLRDNDMIGGMEAKLREVGKKFEGKAAELGGGATAGALPEMIGFGGSVDMPEHQEVYNEQKKDFPDTINVEWVGGKIRISWAESSNLGKKADEADEDTGA